MQQQDKLRAELSRLTDICGQLFETLEQLRPEDESVLTLFGLYEENIMNISQLLQSSEEFSKQYGDGRKSYKIPDCEELMQFLKMYDILTKELF